ncbi:MAG: hypothetical protein QOJ13_3813 [Gaiellales bacterium]|nr:hypothetical protein [Gaiellales bacterium]
MTPTEDALEQQEPTLRADRRGYILAGDSVDGFADRRDLSSEARRKLARWARRFSADDLSDAQVRLLEVADRELASGERELLRAAILDAERDTETTYALGLYQELSDEQLQLVRNPSRNPQLGGRDYPLSMKEMEVLTGATQRQLRYWDQLGLLPTHRINNRRVFLASAVARAFALKEAKQYEVTALAVIARGGPEAARLTRMLGAVLGSVARGVPEPEGHELSRAADLLVTGSGLLVRGVREAGARLMSEAPAAPKPKASTQRRNPKGSRAAAVGGSGNRGRSAARYVVPRQDGQGWAVTTSPKARSSSTYRRKDEAVKAASAAVANQGGGKVVISEKAGKRTVEKPVSPAIGRQSRRTRASS